MRQLLAVVALAILLSGCGNDSGVTERAIKEFAKNCGGPMSAEFYAGYYNRSLTLKCDHFGEITPNAQEGK